MSTKISKLKLELEQKSFKLRFEKIISNLGEDIFKEAINNYCLTNPEVQIDDKPESSENIIESPEFRNALESLKRDNILLDQPTNKVNMVVGGKKVSVDLNKVQQWTFDKETQQLKNYKSGILNIEKTLNQLKLNTNEEIENAINSIYWNLTVYFDQLNNKNFKSSETKHAYQILSIYYGILHNKQIKEDINLYNKLLIHFSINSKSMVFYHLNFKIIFKNSFISYLIQTENINFDFLTTKDNTNLINIKEHLVEKKLIPRDNKGTAGVLLYIGRHLINNKQITATFIKNKLNVSINTINKHYSITFNYFKNNQRLLKSLLN